MTNLITPQRNLRVTWAISLPLCQLSKDSTSLPVSTRRCCQLRDRSRLGAFLHAASVGVALAGPATEGGVDWKTARVLDPAAGGGAFLVQAAQRIVEALGDCEPAFVLKQLASRLLGLELDPNAGRLAQTALDIPLAGIADRSGSPVPQLVRVCDTLEQDPSDDFDLVIGNPPYGRVT